MGGKCHFSFGYLCIMEGIAPKRVSKNQSCRVIITQSQKALSRKAKSDQV